MFLSESAGMLNSELVPSRSLRSRARLPEPALSTITAEFFGDTDVFGCAQFMTERTPTVFFGLQLCNTEHTPPSGRSTLPPLSHLTADDPRMARLEPPDST
jgi:hypothetical protein